MKTTLLCKKWVLRDENQNQCANELLKVKSNAYCQQLLCNNNDVGNIP